MEVRPIEESDRDEWLRMRTTFWPDDHTAEIDEFFAADERSFEVFVLDSGDQLYGFLEVGTRSYAEGCLSSPVAYLEGWWVDPEARQKGLGRKLVQAAEKWAIENGHAEIASDCALDNDISFQAHGSMGYEEVERVICFRKSLPSS